MESEYQYGPLMKGLDTILIVDDDEMNRAILENLFSSFYAVEEAENGREGLEKLTANQEKICAVLLDVVMPEMDGLAGAAHVLEQQAGLVEKIPVFLITAEASDSRHEGGLPQLGVMDVISKPVVPYVVRRRVQLGGGAVPGPAAAGQRGGAAAVGAAAPGPADHPAQSGA